MLGFKPQLPGSSPLSMVRLSAVLVQQNSFLVCSLFQVLVKSGVFILTLLWGSHAFHVPSGEWISTWNQGMARQVWWGGGHWAFVLVLKAISP